MVLPPPGGSNTGCGDREGEDIGPQETEYGRAIRCDATDSGPMRGFGAAEGYKGPPTLVGAEGNRLDTGERQRERRRAVGAAAAAGAVVSAPAVSFAVPSVSASFSLSLASSKSIPFYSHHR